MGVTADEVAQLSGMGGERGREQRCQSVCQRVDGLGNGLLWSNYLKAGTAYRIHSADPLAAHCSQVIAPYEICQAQPIFPSW